MASLRAMFEPLRRALTHPVEELNRWQRSFRYFIDLMRHCGRQLLDDRAEEMAAALTYRTIFSLIPLVVLGLVVFRVFGGFEVVQQRIIPAAYDFFGVPEVDDERYFGVQRTGAVAESAATAAEEVEVREGAAPEPPQEVPVELKPLATEIAEAEARVEAEERAAETGRSPPLPDATENQQVRGAIQKAINELIANISNLNFASIGVVGVVVFIYAAMTLALAVEYDFNIVFKSPTGRPWHLRVPIYWSVITLGSGLLGLSLYMTGEIVHEAEELGFWSGALPFLSRLLAFLASWGLLFLLYVLIPNTRVRLRPAVLGSFVAALLWEGGKVGFQTYVNYALPYAELYGALGLIPLFLFWIYISWLIVLFGLELTYAEQMMRGRRSRFRLVNEECDTLLDPRWLIPIMATIGDGFCDGRTTTTEQLAERTSLPVRAVTQLLQQLQKAGLIHRVDDGHDDEDPGYALAVPPDRITLPRLLELGHEISMQERALKSVPGRETLTELTRVEREAAQHLTLASLLDGGGANGKSSS